MKRPVVILFLCLLFSDAFAAKVDSVKARKVALNFLMERSFLKKNVTVPKIELQLISKKKTADSAALYYIFNFKDKKGFIIVSSDDDIFPVLAYSYESPFKTAGDMPEALKEWIGLTEKQIRFMLDEKPVPGKKVIAAWKKYMAPPAKGTVKIQDVAPLLTTKWNQGKYYNELCPETSSGGQDGHVWVGCVAVAMAQVMKYWNYPDYGSGEHSYTHYTYGEQSADFAHTYYNWSEMPNSLPDYNLPVATLLYHCGVSINMSYGPNGSSAYTGSTARALKEYFDYSREVTMAYKWVYTEEKWDSLVRSQLDMGQPLIYAGGNHAFNIDGYQSTDFFHINWGWGGSYNGYFYLNDLTPGGHDFTSGQHAVFNIRPNCGETATETDTITEPSGTLWDNGDFNYNYVNCSDSRTLIAPENALQIQLTFINFQTVEDQDTLYVYDGEDEHAPLLAVLTGDTLPEPLMSTGGKVFLHFVSDAFTTEKGYEIKYTCGFDDAGVVSMLLPADHICGKTEDSLLVVVRNYGIRTQNAIPVVVEAQTPGGTGTYTATLNTPLATDESDTLFVGTFSTLEPGEYTFTCYTDLQGDTVINENDTVMGYAMVKIPQTIPYYEGVDIGADEWNMHDWNDWHGSTWINREGKEGNAWFSTMAGEHYNQFFIYERKLENVTPYTGIWFDYRILGVQEWPPAADTLHDGEKIHFIVSTDCGEDFDTVFTIDETNHIPDTLFRKVYVPLRSFAGKKILIGFTTEWDSVWSTVDYDNILVVDSVHNNVIAGHDICEGETLSLTGSTALGGTGSLTYRWEESGDGQTWTEASQINSLQDYTDPFFSSSKYFRRIVTDTLFYADTSFTKHIRTIPWPVPVITPDTDICAGDMLELNVSGADAFRWNTGATDSTILVSPSGDVRYTVILTNENRCVVDTSVTVTVHPLPDVDIGSDTAICDGESLVLDAGDFAEYLWSTGSDARQITVSTEGTRHVTVTDAHGCENADTIEVEFQSCTGIAAVHRQRIVIYPNPSDGIFYVRGLQPEEVAGIEVADPAGRIVARIEPIVKLQQIDLQQDAPGIYFIRIIYKDSSTVVKRIRKERGR